MVMLIIGQCLIRITLLVGQCVMTEIGVRQESVMPCSVHAMPDGKVGGSNRVVSMHAAADYLGITYKYFAANYKAWGIACHHIGKYVRFRERDLESYLDRTREVLQ
jgi:hypothetical protein